MSLLHCRVVVKSQTGKSESPIGESKSGSLKNGTRVRVSRPSTTTLASLSPSHYKTELESESRVRVLQLCYTVFRCATVKHVVGDSRSLMLKANRYSKSADVFNLVLAGRIVCCVTEQLLSLGLTSRDIRLTSLGSLTERENTVYSLCALYKPVEAKILAVKLCIRTLYGV
jgi:hypothetical protein